MKKLSFLFLLFTCSLVAVSQSNFLLYSFKGNVSVIENGAESKAKVGKMLTGTASLKLAAGGSVTMICNEAAMFTLTKAGTYPLSKFGDSCKASSSSVSANYVKYVWASMTKSTGNPGSNRSAYMNTVGAVSRTVNSIFIDFKLDTINYSAGVFPLSWSCYNREAKEFVFMLYSNDNISEPVFTKVVTKLKIPITDIAVKMKQGNNYYWTVAVKGEENDELKVLNYVSKETFETMLKDLKGQGAANEAPAEQAYRLGFMLEDSHYLAEAYQQYTTAAKLDSNNVLYRSTLMLFKKDYEIK